MANYLEQKRNSECNKNWLVMEGNNLGIADSLI
jgi:hypothetical protein